MELSLLLLDHATALLAKKQDEAKGVTVHFYHD